MSITLGCMAYNEERFLPGLLRNATQSAHIDEILIVDTGSTDATANIARQAGATVEHYPSGVTSFADARNFLLSHVKTDWLLFLDADEEPGPGMLSGIQKATATPNQDFDAATVQRYNFFANGSFYLSTELKLLRMGAGPKYSGEVAETPVPSLSGEVRDLPLILNHFGHARPFGDRHRKALRYLKSMGHEIDSASSRAAGIARAAALIERSIGNTDSARALIRRAEELSSRSAKVAFVSAHVDRSDPLVWPGTKGFEESYRLNPDDPSIFNLHAVSRLCAGDSRGAVALLKQGAERWPHLPHFRLNLGLAHQIAGDDAEALALLDLLARDHPAFGFEDPAGRLEFDPWRPLMSETIPGYAGLDYHRSYLRSARGASDATA